MTNIYRKGNVIVSDWIPPSGTVSIDDVKGEAHRRIVQVVPEWKQLNLLARYTELIKIGEQNWTSEQQEEAFLIETTWDKVKHIQAKSNELESMSPIPEDYKDDKYWE